MSVEITSAGGLTNQPTQTVSGTVDVAGAGTMVTLYDGATAIGTAIVQTNGSWSDTVTLTTNGINTLTAKDTDAAGNTGTSNPVVYTLTTDALAYAATGNDLFGVVDLNTGVFTELGDMGQRLVGLGVGPGGVLYGAAYSGSGYGAYSSPTLYSVNPTNGALTVVSNSFSAGYYDFGSTTTGLYADGSDGNLYSINPNTGAATLIGPTLLGNFMSTGSSTLYVTGLNDLSSINTTTGAATLIGFPNAGYIAVVAEGGTFYAVSEDFRTYTLNPSNGSATFLSNVSGTSSFFWGLAPDPLSATIPIPPTVTLISATTDNGTTNLNVGHVVTITVNTSSLVNVTGIPTLQLNDNEVATYQTGTGTPTLTFAYTVHPGDNIADLQVTGLNLPSGATIQDAAGNNLSGAVTANLGIQIDTPSGAETPEKPSLTLSSSLSVSPGTSIPMGITASPVDSDGHSINNDQGGPKL